jgi:thiamine-monophosphate kinase
VNPFTQARRLSAASLGEEGLIAAIRGWLGSANPPSPGGIGDDCAVLPRIRGRVLVTVDPVVRGRHFDDELPAAAVGAKLLKRNLSDVAAMGGRPVAAVVSLLLDPRTRLDWLEGFYRGLAACARRHRTGIVGGDVAQAPGALAASLTLVGSAGPRVLERRGARPGDWICVTGLLGRSLPTGHHHRFAPRLAEGGWLARRPEVRSMIDVSDGLAKDLRALAPPGCEPAVGPALVPRRAKASIAEALADGEDYELAFSLAAGASWAAFEAAWARAFPRVRISRIGRFVPEGRIPDGSISLGEFRGYEHLSGA